MPPWSSSSGACSVPSRRAGAAAGLTVGDSNEGPGRADAGALLRLTCSPDCPPYDEVRWFSTALAMLTCPALSTVTVPAFPPLTLPSR